MTVDRFLGAAWASIHGPADPRDHLLWLLDHGFRGHVAGPSPRPMAWARMRAAADDLPVRWPAWRREDIFDSRRLPPLGLASPPGEASAYLRQVADAVRCARTLGSACVVLEAGLVPIRGEEGDTDLLDATVGWKADTAEAQHARRVVARDQALDRVCRNLFELLRTFDDMTFCLVASRHATGVADPSGLQAVFEDLGHPRLGYWHEAAVVARRAELLGEDQGGWLEPFANLMRGITLGDCADGRGYLPPGAGAVDHGLLSSYVPRSSGVMAAVIELDPAVDPAELAGAVAFLDKIDL